MNTQIESDTANIYYTILSSMVSTLEILTCLALCRRLFKMGEKLESLPHLCDFIMNLFFV